jgi:pyruvate/2-oxoglutarate/acetoin dehydrogenase E1 component/glycine cleavage system H lipoate-binding protein
MREITLSQAVNEALAEEMRRDPTVFILGEDVAEAGTPFKVLSGLVEEFGTDRVIDTPISEPGFVGIAVGAAMTGARPVVDLMFGDFIYLVMDQLCNQAAKQHYMSGGKLTVPMVLRTNLGATRRSAAQHSQSLQALVAHIPGLKVALPSSAYEAKGLMKTAIRDNNPVVIFEDKLMYQDKAPVPEEEYLIPFGEANVKREGRDITLIATSSMVQVAEKAAAMLEKEGIDAEVIDPRTIVPLDEKTLLESVRKTSRAIVIDEGHQSYGVTAEIAARLNEKAFYHLDAPVLRMGAMDVPVPFSPALEDLTVPTPEAWSRTPASFARGSSFMPHDVTMPQLGMAQDAGKIVSWLKSPGDAVSRGDALFEVETDKAVMEVESPADGFLTGVSYGEGEDVPVGKVIARISDSARMMARPRPKPCAEEAAPDAGDDLPEGHSVTMPQLGMAQDTGLLVNWLKAPGDEVAADDILFEVETDKSTMEVEAGRAGWLAATLAEAGEEVPVGDPVAIISGA